jgi:hypothetical protein
LPLSGREEVPWRRSRSFYSTSSPDLLPAFLCPEGPKGPQHVSPGQSAAAQPRSAALGTEIPDPVALKGHNITDQIPNIRLIEFDGVPREQRSTLASPRAAAFHANVAPRLNTLR